MAAHSFFDRQQALRRLTRVLLLLTALGALGSAMVGGLLTLLVYLHAESSDPASVASIDAHHAFLAGAVAMVGLIALVALVHCGASQGSCRLNHAAICRVCSALAAVVLTTESRSGLRLTTPMCDQSRVLPDQRLGLHCRAWMYSAWRAARIA